MSQFSHDYIPIHHCDSCGESFTFAELTNVSGFELCDRCLLFSDFYDLPFPDSPANANLDPLPF